MGKKDFRYRELLQRGEEILEEAGLKEAKTDAWFLLEDITKMSRSSYFLNQEDKVEEEVIRKYFSFLEKRLKRMPVSYITGSRGFMGLDFFVNEAVLIPEQDTELLVEEALKICDDKMVLDLCTGSGCIAISILKHGKPRFVVGSDISEAALSVANRNLILLEKEEKAKIEFQKSDLFCSINRKFDLIVSNPPYIESDTIDELEPEVSIYEPRLALDGDEDGLKFYKIIIEESPNYFSEEGYLLLEIGAFQANKVKKMLLDRGFVEIKVLKDLAGWDRVVIAKFRNESQKGS